MFQSAPGLATGGNDLAVCTQACSTGRFNPPPVSRPGETSGGFLYFGVVKCFNPPPVSRPGETAGHGRAGPGAASFNPPPVSRPGETGSGTAVCSGGSRVSIRPRSRDRGKLVIHVVRTGDSDEFQSAPGLATGGNPGESVGGAAGRPVSIRPRSRDRGKRVTANRPAAYYSSFNPPPVSRPGETPSGGFLYFGVVTCFNPPPVSRPGETWSKSQSISQCRVSIRPRSRDRGKPRCCPPPAPRWRRFNPPPVSRPGETSR